MELGDGNPHWWTCPIPNCTHKYFNYCDLPIHIRETHGEHTRRMDDYVGGFWTATTLIILASTTDEQGFIDWPIIREVCPKNSENNFFDLIPIPFNRAQELWMYHNDTNSQHLSFQDIIPMTNSPLNNLIDDYIHYASKKGRLKRIEISLPIHGRNFSNEEG
jgi:hypothetical protein